MAENRRSQADIEDRIESNRYMSLYARDKAEFDDMKTRFGGDKYVTVIDQNGKRHNMGSK